MWYMTICKCIMMPTNLLYTNGPMHVQHICPVLLKSKLHTWLWQVCAVTLELISIIRLYIHLQDVH